MDESRQRFGGRGIRGQRRRWPIHLSRERHERHSRLVAGTSCHSSEGDGSRGTHGRGIPVSPGRVRFGLCWFIGPTARRVYPLPDGPRRGQHRSGVGLRGVASPTSRAFEARMRLAEFVGPQAQHDVDSPTTGYDKLVLSADWTRSSGSIEPRTSRQNTIILQRKLRLAHRWRESVALIEYPETASQRLADSRAHPNVVVAIPAFNEGPTIGSVVLKARQFASEVVVVDDGSTDDTAETATLAGAHVIRHARNLGKGMAIRSAWLYAREREDRKSTRLNSSHLVISYAVFCLKKKKRCRPDAVRGCHSKDRGS